MHSEAGINHTCTAQSRLLTSVRFWLVNLSYEVLTVSVKEDTRQALFTRGTCGIQ